MPEHPKTTGRGPVVGATPSTVLRIVDGITPGTALDIATRDGRNVIWLSSQGWDTIAVDISAEALEIARTRQHGEGGQLGWDPCRHTGLDSGRPIRPHHHDLRAFLAAGRPHADQCVSRCLAPGGILLVIGHDFGNLASEEHAPQNPDVPYTAELLRVAAAALSGVRAASIYRDPENDPELSPDLSAIAVDTLLLARRHPEPTHVP